MKMAFKNKEQIKTFSDIQNLKEFITIKSALKKNVIYIMKCYTTNTHKKTVIACINSAQSHKHSYELKKASHKWTCAAGSIYMKT